MGEDNPHVLGRPRLSISPYLLRPLRSYEQARSEIAAAKKRANTVTPFVPLVVVTTDPRRSEMQATSYRAA